MNLYQRAYGSFQVRLDQRLEAGRPEHERRLLSSLWERSPEEWELRKVAADWWRDEEGRWHLPRPLNFIRYRRMEVPLTPLPDSGPLPANAIEEVSATLDQWGDLITIDERAMLSRRLLDRTQARLSSSYVYNMYVGQLNDARFIDTVYVPQVYRSKLLNNTEWDPVNKTLIFLRSRTLPLPKRPRHTSQKDFTALQTFIQKRNKGRRS